MWAYSSQAALTAVSLAFPVQMLLVAVSVGTGHWYSIRLSQGRLGEKRFAEANSAATHGVLLAIASWVLFVILGALFY